jgi:hypothetical protein
MDPLVLRQLATRTEGMRSLSLSSYAPSRYTASKIHPLFITNHSWREQCCFPYLKTSLHMHRITWCREYFWMTNWLSWTQSFASRVRSFQVSILAIMAEVRAIFLSPEWKFCSKINTRRWWWLSQNYDYTDSHNDWIFGNYPQSRFNFKHRFGDRTQLSSSGNGHLWMYELALSIGFNWVDYFLEGGDKTSGLWNVVSNKNTAKHMS